MLESVILAIVIYGQMQILTEWWKVISIIVFLLMYGVVSLTIRLLCILKVTFFPQITLLGCLHISFNK